MDFYDTGLLCYLLGISKKASLEKHTLYGSIFENWIITEIKKNRLNTGINGGLYFFRDSLGNEIDLLMEKEDKTIAVEIKAAKKISSGMFGGLRYWSRNNPGSSRILVYGGTKSDTMEEIQIVSWKEILEL